MSNNQVTLRQKLKSYRRTPFSFFVMLLVLLAAVITFAVLFFLIAYVLLHGVPYLTPSLFSLTYTSENASLMPALINTVIMTLLSLLIAVPLGIFSAIFLVEYAGRGNKFVEVIQAYHGDLAGNLSYCIWIVRNVVLCVNLRMGIFDSGRSIYTVDHGTAADYAQYRRSIKGSAGLLQRRKLRIGSGEIKNSFSNCSSVCHTGNLSGCDSCSGTHRR